MEKICKKIKEENMNVKRNYIFISKCSELWAIYPELLWFM